MTRSRIRWVWPQPRQACTHRGLSAVQITRVASCTCWQPWAQSSVAVLQAVDSGDLEQHCC